MGSEGEGAKRDGENVGDSGPEAKRRNAVEEVPSDEEWVEVPSEVPSEEEPSEEVPSEEEGDDVLSEESNDAMEYLVWKLEEAVEQPEEAARAPPQAGFTAAERCAERLARESEAERYAKDNRDLTLGEQIIRVPLTRDLTIPLDRSLNPYKLADLQYVLNFRTFYGLLPDVDLKEIYFEGAWGFRKDEFVLANWREMSVEEMKSELTRRELRWALRTLGISYVYPPDKVDVDSVTTMDEIVRAFWELTYVPEDVYRTAVGGAHVLRSVKAGHVGEDPRVARRYLFSACRAGLDLPVIRGLAEKCGKEDIAVAAERAAEGGHADVLDLLASEFGAVIGVDCLTEAARWGHDAMIDHLVEEYGVDPDAAARRNGWTALYYAAEHGRVHTVKHLVEKHNVDIHKRNTSGKTALDETERKGKTESAAYLRTLTYTQLLAGEYRGDADVEIFLSAVRRGDDAMIDLLVERYGVDPNGVDRHGWTALHFAASSGRVSTVKHLVQKHNVDMHKRNRYGDTALDVAELCDRTECADYLRALQSTRPPAS